MRVVGERWAPRSHEATRPAPAQRGLVHVPRAGLGGGASAPRRGRAVGSPLAVVVLLDGQTLVAPTNAELAAALVGVDDGQDTAELAAFDVIIVGAGPAGSPPPSTRPRRG